jgi:integrase
MIRSEPMTWIDGHTSEKSKTKKSLSAAPMAAELAQVLRERQKTTAYGNPADWVFASPKTHGRRHRVDRSRSSAARRYQGRSKAQARSAIRISQPTASLSTLLITGQKEDVRTTQDILRHSNSATTLDPLHAIANGAANRGARVALSAILKEPTARVRIRGVRRRAGRG